MKAYLSVPGSRLLLAIAAVVCLGAGSAVLGQAHDQEVEAALEGLDPVLLVQGKEVMGSLKISSVRGRFKYYFVNEEDKATFEKEPTRYEIQLNGACARMGAPVEGSLDNYAVHNGRIYIFGSEECKTRFVAAPEKYLEDESAAKPKQPASPEALKKGQELIEKAVTSMAGPAVIDGLTSYQEKSTSQQRRRGGDVDVKTSLTIVFPNSIRTDQVAPDYNNPSVKREVAVVLTSTDAFATTANETRPVAAATQTNQQQELNRRPLAILRARKGSGFRAIAAGSTNVAETAVEQVVVDLDGASHTLGIDPATGRILSLSYRRRGPDGDFGQVVKIFSDFRIVNGVTLPFKVAATFNGEPWKEQSSTIESITINGTVDPAVFEKPKVSKVE